LKFDSAKNFVPVPIVSMKSKNRLGLISYGSSDMPVIEAIDQFTADGIGFDYMRIRAIPFSASVNEFLTHHEHVFVVECNRDGQMKGILSIQYTQHAEKLISISHLDGLSLSAEWIKKEIAKHLQDINYGKTKI